MFKAYSIILVVIMTLQILRSSSRNTGTSATLISLVICPLAGKYTSKTHEGTQVPECYWGSTRKAHAVSTHVIIFLLSVWLLPLKYCILHGLSLPMYHALFHWLDNIYEGEEQEGEDEFRPSVKTAANGALWIRVDKNVLELRVKQGLLSAWPRCYTYMS